MRATIRPTVPFRASADIRDRLSPLGQISRMVIAASGLVAIGSIGTVFVAGTPSVGGIDISLLLLLSVLVINALGRK